MDFVVAGLGFGALVVVIGFALRDLGPLFHRTSGLLSPDDRTAEQLRWNSLCHSIGSLLGKAGGGIILVTAIAIVAGVSDSIGLLAVLISSVVAAGISVTLIIRSIREFGRTSQAPILSYGVQTIGPTPPPESDRRQQILAKRVSPVAESALEPGPTELVAAIPNLPDETSEVLVEATAPVIVTTERTVDSAPSIPRSADSSAPPPVIWDIRSTAFKSAILADIGQQDTPLPSQGFTSQILSDVPVDPPGESYASPLLENLDDSDEVEADQPGSPHGEIGDEGGSPADPIDEIDSEEASQVVVVTDGLESQEPESSIDESGSGEDSVIDVRHSGLV